MIIFAKSNNGGIRPKQMVDLHCHILPGVDDGSKSWDMTAEMCRLAARDGITHIVATPHCNDQFAYDRDQYTEMLAKLSEVALGKLSFSLGCDFHFSYENIRDALANPRRYTIGDTPYLLVEFSEYGLPPTAKDDLLTLARNGMVPIITHPERNPILQGKPEMVLDFLDQGCIIQVTANSLTGFWGPRAQSMTQWLLQRRAVHVIASDAHDPVRRKPILSEAWHVVARGVGATIGDILVTYVAELNACRTALN